MESHGGYPAKQGLIGTEMDENPWYMDHYDTKNSPLIGYFNIGGLKIPVDIEHVQCCFEGSRIRLVIPFVKIRDLASPQITRRSVYVA